MKRSLSRFVLAVEILAALLVLGPIFVWAPVCDGLLTLDSGKLVHMKCFYTGQASVILAIVLLITAMTAYFSKVDHNLVHWIAVAIGAMLVAVTFESVIGIGICKMKTMACNTTALWVRAAGVLAVTGGLFDILANNSKTSRLTL